MSSENPGQTDSFAHGASSTAPAQGAAPVGAAPVSPPEARSGKFGGWLILLLLALAFAGGIGAALWGWPKARSWWNGGDAGGNATVQTLADTAPARQGAGATSATGNAAITGTDTSLGVATLEARLAAVATRLDAITEQANKAGSNAARAEGLMVAFAARRALDRGSPLNYLEAELRLRFADAQPRAVATIINASHAPVTIADLQAGLEDIAPKLLGTGGASDDWWTATRRELSNLVIIRKADAPSPVPQKVIERARLLISVGRVNSALEEIERLPGHKQAENWLQKARQYNEARRALDVIEAAAILEPRSVPTAAPVPTSPNGQSLQVAPTPEEESGSTAPAPATNRPENHNAPARQ